MKTEPITWKTYALAIALVACLVIGIAICGGALGPSDLELRVRASEPIKL